MGLDGERRATVLLVDDERDNRETLVEVLETYGHHVVAVENGRQALDYLRHNPPPCLLLLDLLMPEMSGYQLMALRKTEACLAGIPVVLLTGAADVEQREELSGAVFCLSKPVQLPVLIKVVGVFCRRLTPAEITSERT